jgi:hypothetical protein
LRYVEAAGRCHGRRKTCAVRRRARNHARH